MDERAALPSATSDEDLIAAMRAGDQEALSTLYARYAPLVFHIAGQSLGASAAEEIVQDVFFSVWQKAESYDRDRGACRPWLLQIAHFRVLNELRRQSRRPKLELDSDPDKIEELPDDDSGPIEQAWGNYRRQTVRAAIEKLPRHQRQALSLAFFEELSHDQVAEALNIPLGTVKTRIRSGVRELRRILLPLGIVGALALSLLGVGWALRTQLMISMRGDRALSFVTASDISLIHLGAAPGQDPRTHGSYRGREGTAMAVVALHDLPPEPRGEIYRVWVRNKGIWIELGTAKVAQSGGDAVVIGENPALRALPEAVEVRRESPVAGTMPRGIPIAGWESSLKAGN